MTKFSNVRPARHSENILFDATTGDCIHVDFACLFNKGEALAVPERVPFRLTQNIVDPMGVSGYFGGFTNISTVAMKVTCLPLPAIRKTSPGALHAGLQWRSRRPTAVS
jgi:serine/threonine-protein kinase ATR